MRILTEGCGATERRAMYQKSCSYCHAFKPLEAFDHSRKSRDNHHHRCKACDRKRDKQRLANGSHARSIREWTHRNPAAAKAHRLLRAAIKRGDIKRGPCIECGKPGAHGHHDDYNKPLDVTWLCHLCHMEHHRQERLYGKEQTVFEFFWEGRP
jgi:hypothetical protein